MKIISPKPFTYRGGNKAVLLLHGFTGSTIDVKMLGNYLHERGFTCHAPLYKGHGSGPDELIQTGPDEWWQDALDGYHFLEAEGFSDIAVAGVSLGGVFSLKIGAELPVKGIVSMCAPIQEKSLDDLYLRVLNYAKQYKKIEGKDDEQIRAELEELKQRPMPSLKHLQQLIVHTREKLASISSPIFVLQGCLDESLYQESARILYNHVHSEIKQLKWYEQSGHIITLGKEREKVCKDVYAFLQSLNW
ncbi:carboxylesterase [Fictibacillus sp. Mic-4]|uniref:alpha/beta hydrolase n=1 Tax=Fictibacillus TaxID=1329200 RepID=UPI00042895E0|nr:carboxylesterase [Fictibacillus gelatini]